MALISFSVFSVYAFIVDILVNSIGSYFQELSPISMYGNMRGFTIVNFILLYIVGAYIKRFEKEFSSSKTLAIVLTSIVAIFLISLWNECAWNYNSPLVIISASGVFILFNRLKFNSKIINKLSRATLTTYLIHIFLLRFINIEYFVNQNLLILILHQLVSCILIFLISFVVFTVYDEISKLISKIIMNTKNKE